MHPNGALRRYWDMFSMALLLYTTIVTPFEIAFNVDSAYPTTMYFLQQIIDVGFGMDLLLNFFTMYIEPDSKVLIDHIGRIASKYLQSWFLLDLVSTLPWDLMFEAINQSSEADVGNILKLPKLVRLVRLVRLVKLLRVLRIARLVKRLQSRIGIRFGVVKILKFIFFVALATHWNACLWYMTADMVNATPGSGEPMVDTWITGYFEKRIQCLDTSESLMKLYGKFNDSAFLEAASALANHSALAQSAAERLAERQMLQRGVCYEWEVGVDSPELYLASLYWSIMTLTTIGYGDVIPQTNEERIVAMVLMLIDASLFAFMISSITSLVSTLNFRIQRFEAKMDHLDGYMKAARLPESLRGTLREFFTVSEKWTMQHNGDLFADMTKSLQGEAMAWCYRDLIRRVPAFQGTDDRFIAALASAFKLRIYPPQEFVYSEGDPAHHLVFVNKGLVVVLDRSGRQVQRVRDHGSFGQDALFTADRMYSAQSLVFSCLLELGEKDIWKVTKQYPLVRKRLMQGSLRMIVQRFIMLPEKARSDLVPRLRNATDKGMPAARRAFGEPADGSAGSTPIVGSPVLTVSGRLPSTKGAPGKRSVLRTTSRPRVAGAGVSASAHVVAGSTADEEFDEDRDPRLMTDALISHIRWQDEQLTALQGFWDHDVSMLRGDIAALRSDMEGSMATLVELISEAREMAAKAAQRKAPSPLKESLSFNLKKASVLVSNPTGSFRLKKPPPVMSKAEVGLEAAGALGSVAEEPATFPVRRSTPKEEVTVTGP